MSDNGLANRAKFLQPAERRYTEIEIEDFGRIRLQSLSEREQADYDMSILDSKGRWSRRAASNARRRLIALTVVDADGNRVFHDSEIDALGELDGQIANAIYEAAEAHCGSAAKQIEQAEKN